MASYEVSWIIDIDDAGDPLEAAKLACATMLDVDPSDPGGATSFMVIDRDTRQRFFCDVATDAIEADAP